MESSFETNGSLMFGLVNNRFGFSSSLIFLGLYLLVEHKRQTKFPPIMLKG